MRTANIPDNIVALQGPVLLGYMFSWGLFGVLAVQTYIYYNTFRRDNKALKALVYVIFFAECFLSFVQTHSAWYSFVSGWGDVATLRTPVWTLNAAPAICGFISSTVQIFFCWRIWVLSKIWILSLVISLIALTQWAAAFYCGIHLALLHDMSKISTEIPIIIVWIGGSALCDVMITSTMIYFLMRAARRSSFRSTETVLDQLIRLTMETGMVTTVGALTELILFFVSESTNIHFIMFFMLGRLYSNSLMVTLNARSKISKNSYTLTSTLWESRGYPDPARGPRETGATPVAIHITAAYDTRVDEQELVTVPHKDVKDGQSSYSAGDREDSSDDFV